MESLDINFYSLNANGLRNKAKRIAVFTKLKKLGKGIFLLEETHSIKTTENTWTSQWGNQNIKFSHGSSNSRSVAILFSCELDNNFEQEITDINSRYIILDIECDSYTFNIANLHAPTKNFEREQIYRFQTLYKDLLEFKRENLILGVDLNLYLNPRVDKLHPLLKVLLIFGE